jgi:hypothetical protein
MKTYRAKVIELQTGAAPAGSNEWEIFAKDEQDAVLIGRGAKPTHEAVKAWVDVLQKALGGVGLPVLAQSARQAAQSLELQFLYILAATRSGDVFYSPFPTTATDFAAQFIYAATKRGSLLPMRLFVFDWSTLTAKAAFQGWIDENGTWQKL